MHDKMKIYRAGVIPYYVDEENVIHMLFMKPSNSQYGGDINPITNEYEIRYQLAKGRVEKTETAEEAALREGEEEVGLIKENIFGVWHVGVFLGRTDVYIAKIIDKDNFKPHHYETESTKWLTLDQFKEEGRSLHYDLVEKSHYLIELQENVNGSINNWW